MASRTSFIRRLRLGLTGLFVASFALGQIAVASAELTYRTDSSSNDKLPWFQLQPGEFPPEDAAHYLSGELIGIDHINRTGILRQDRSDAIRRGDWDQPLPFVILPYGSLRYHGAPAELRDIPIGTHLHGLFFWDSKAGKDGKGAFKNVLRLEDDFSFLSRQQRSWRVESVDLEKGIFNVTGGSANSSDTAKPTAFQISASTRVWKDQSIGKLADIAPGQSVLLNLTVCTLKGPGRCTDIWLNDESRDVASAQQVEVHRQYQREHGLAGWIDEVDNKEGTVTATLFGGFDPALAAEFKVKESVQAAVAEDSLRTYDQINDRIGGSILAIDNVPPASGSSGTRIKFKPGNLLEGFRPKRIIRLFAGRWKVDDLPREEQLYK
ncbi:hypothetical protein ACXR0O_07120 [Verrucomicrobiota bacterium sgz303538]